MSDLATVLRLHLQHSSISPMRILLFTCSLLALVSLLVPNLQATSSVAGPGTVIRGKITKIEDGLGTFVLTSKEGKSVAVRTKDKTKFFVDGVAAKFDDLEVGQFARVRGRFKKDANGKTFFGARAVRAKTPK